jgi:peptide/nickel transport system permease protein
MNSLRSLSDGKVRAMPPALFFGGLVLLALVVIGLLAPWLWPYDPAKMAVDKRLMAPSVEHIFGTDEFGRDLFSRVLAGTRVSLGIGAAAVLTGLVFGGVLGMLAAFSGRLLSSAVLRIVEVLYSLPDTLIALSLVAFLGPGIVNATLAIAISLIPFYARVTYGLAATESVRPYIEAAKLSGIGNARLMRVHLLPNIAQSLIVMCALGFSAAILSVAGLSFLGLGVQPPSPEWGAILSSGRNYVGKAPWIMIFPGLAIVLAAMTLNLVGDGIRDFVDPRLRSRK